VPPRHRRPWSAAALGPRHRRRPAYSSTKDKGQEVENQLRQLREFAGTQSWSIVREYIDRETGSTGDRDQFKAMCVDASRRHFDCLLFWSLDRLTREGTLETLQYLNWLAA